MSELTGIAAALGSAVSWALGSILFKKIGEKTKSIAITTVKALLSAIMLGLFIIIVRINPFINSHSLIRLIISGILGIAIGDTFFFASLKRLSPVILSILLFSGPAIFSGILGLVYLNETPSLQVWIGILIVLSGLGCLLFPIETKDQNVPQTTLSGMVFAILSLFCTSISMVIAKPVLLEVSSLVATMYRMLFGGLFLLAYGLIFGKIKAWEQPFLDKDYNLKFLGTVSIVTFGGFWLSLVAIKNCDLVVASTLMTLEPLFIMLYMILFWKYKMKLKEYLGTFLSIVGIMLIAFYSM